MANAILFSKNNLELSYTLQTILKTQKIRFYISDSFTALLNDIKSLSPEFLFLDISSINCTPEILNTFSSDGCFNINYVVAIVQSKDEDLHLNNSFYKVNEFELSDKLPFILEKCVANTKKHAVAKSNHGNPVDINLLNAILCEYGFSIKHLGYIYLRYAVQAILDKYGNFRSLNTMIYPFVAKSFHTTVSSVERNIRSAINFAYQRNSVVANEIAKLGNAKSLSNKKVVFYLVDLYISRSSKKAL